MFGRDGFLKKSDVDQLNASFALNLKCPKRLFNICDTETSDASILPSTILPYNRMIRYWQAYISSSIPLNYDFAIKKSDFPNNRADRVVVIDVTTFTRYYHIGSSYITFDYTYGTLFTLQIEYDASYLKSA